MSCASSGHITKHKQSIFAPFDIYDLPITTDALLIMLVSMETGS
jgi:hypothetical protein